MPHGRKVSGNFIKALADVPISAAVQLPRLLHAAIKIQATCKHVEDDTGRQVTLADVKGLTGKFAAVASRAQNILQRTAETIVNAKRNAAVELSDFEKMIFLSVVGKVDESPEIIAANFVTTFFGPQSSADAPDASSSGGESKPPCIVEFGLISLMPAMATIGTIVIVDGSKSDMAITFRSGFAITVTSDVSSSHS